MELKTSRGIRLHQMAIRQGKPEVNGAEILRRMERDRADGIRLSVFPEWALTGPLGAGEWLDPALGAACDEWLERIVAATAEGGAVLLGTACLWRGKRVGAAVAAENGTFVFPEGSPLMFIPKLPCDADRFDAWTGGAAALAIAYAEGVSPETLFAPFRFGSLTVGVWCGGAAPALDARYGAEGCDTLIQLRSQPYMRDKAPFYPASVDRPILMCGGVGLADAGKVVFALTGGTGWVYPNGQIRLAPVLQECALDWGMGNGTEAQADSAAPEMTVRVIEFALRTYLERLGLERVVIGASGGIDSALSAAIYSRVLADPAQLLLVNMPSRNNSQTTISLARQLATAIGCNYTDIPIEESLALTARQIEGRVCERPGSDAPGVHLHLSPLAIENVQARDRSGRILSALSSAFGGVFTCNANKAECTVGYGTLYGDISGFFAVLGDLWKREVWELARFYNRSVFRREVIPQGSIDITPSAELSAQQNVDEGKGDPLIYPWHDRLFAAWTEREWPASRESLLAWYREGTLAREVGYDGDIHALFPTEEAFAADLARYGRLYQGLSRAKRLQAPPILSLKSRTFGFDLGAAQI